jgi:hypothetical protein
MTTPDEALLWARERDAQRYEEFEVPALAQMSREGGNDSCEVLDLAEAYRAGQSANAERVAVLTAERDAAVAEVAQIVAWLRAGGIYANGHGGPSTYAMFRNVADAIAAGAHKPLPAPPTAE